MFEDIYRRESSSVGSGRSSIALLEELGELAEAVRVYDRHPKYFAGEAADVFSYLMGFANEYSSKLQIQDDSQFDFQASFLRRYPGLCPQCGYTVCICPSVPDSTVGRMAKELELASVNELFTLDLSEAERKGKEIGSSVLRELGGLSAIEHLPLDRGETNRAMVILCLRLSDEMRQKNEKLATELRDAAIQTASDAKAAGSRQHGLASFEAVDLLSSVWPLLSLAVPAEDKSLSASLGRVFRVQSVRIGIVTALAKEFAAMREMLDESRTNSVVGDPNDYIIGTIPATDGSGNHTVVLTFLKEIGNNNAAVAATHLIRSFPSVEDILMVGIAGGVPAPETPQQHIRLGDIVVSETKGVVQYDNLKLESNRISLRGSGLRPSARLVGAVKGLEADRIANRHPWEELILRGSKLESAGRPSDKTDRLFKWEGSNPVQISHPLDPTRRSGQPKLHYGPIGASNALLKNPALRDKLRRDCGVIAIEMEGSGIADAVWNTGKHYLVIRGICDYCDEKKNDKWQGYASVVAAAYARAVISAVSLDSYKATERPTQAVLPSTPFG